MPVNLSNAGEAVAPEFSVGPRVSEENRFLASSLQGLGNVIGDFFIRGAEEKANAAKAAEEARLNAARAAVGAEELAAERALLGVDEEGEDEFSPEQLGALAKNEQNNNKARKIADTYPTRARRAAIISNLGRTRLLQQFPELAKEFKAEVFGISPFASKALEAEKEARDATVDREAKILASSAAALREQALRLGDTSLLGITDDAAVIRIAPTMQIFKNYRATQEATEAHKQIVAIQGAKAAADDVIIREQAERVIPGQRQGLQAALQKILDIEADGPQGATDKVQLMRKVLAQALAARAEAFPQTPADKIKALYGNEFEDITELYIKMASGGTLAEEAGATLKALQATSEIDLRGRVPNMDAQVFFTTQISKIGAALGPTWLLANQSNLKETITPFINDLLDLQSSGSVRPDQASNRSSAKVEGDADKMISMMGDMSKKYNLLEPAQRKAAANRVVNGLASPDAKRAPASRDKWLAWMATDDFRTIAKTEEFQETFNNSTAPRVMDGILKDMTSAAINSISSMRGVGFVMDKETGLLMATDTNRGGGRGGTGGQINPAKLAAINDKLIKAQKAYGNIYGFTGKQAAAKFYKDYLRPQ